jgi:DNA-binding MurR/RpiR family transcriptional regulator
MSDVSMRIEERRSALTPAERRVAEAVLADPRAVAFGTVAELADRSGASGASVVRLATRLGYDGFVDMQAAVQDDVGGQHLGPAVERIRQPVASDAVARTLEVELANVRRTLESIDPGDHRKAVGLMADPARAVHVLAGDAEEGIGAMLASSLSMLRPGVSQVAGSDAAVARQLAALARRDVVIALDLRRYERWVLSHAGAAADRGARVIAITDGALSPLTDIATVAFVVAASGVGPFDSHVGTLALANSLVTGVAATLRSTATRRLDRVEAAWQACGALVDT